MGNRGVGDGRCIIDVRLWPYATGRLSPQRLAFGLLYVLDECVRAGPPALAGVVQNMGLFVIFFYYLLLAGYMFCGLVGLMCEQAVTTMLAPLWTTTNPPFAACLVHHSTPT